MKFYKYFHKEGILHYKRKTFHTVFACKKNTYSKLFVNSRKLKSGIKSADISISIKFC